MTTPDKAIGVGCLAAKPVLVRISAAKQPARWRLKKPRVQRGEDRVSKELVIAVARRRPAIATNDGRLQRSIHVSPEQTKC